MGGFRISGITIQQSKNKALYARRRPDRTAHTIASTQFGVAMPQFHRAVFFFLAAFLLVQLASPASAQANRKTLNQVSQLLLKAHKFLSEEQNTGAARAECEKAQAIEARAKDAFISATVHVCFGDVADYEENAREACGHYDAALKDFEAVPARHSARRTLKTHMNVTEGKRMTLACGA